MLDFMSAGHPIKKALYHKDRGLLKQIYIEWIMRD